MPIDLKTLELDTFQLYAGKHQPNGHGCFMEVASQIAGEEWTDYPECVSPVIAAFGRSWNDALPDACGERSTKSDPRALCRSGRGCTPMQQCCKGRNERNRTRRASTNDRYHARDRLFCEGRNPC